MLKCIRLKKNVLHDLQFTKFGGTYLQLISAEVSLKISWRYHQIVSFEDRAKHCLKNECTLLKNFLESTRRKKKSWTLNFPASPNQPKSQILFHKKSSPQDLIKRNLHWNQEIRENAVSTWTRSICLDISLCSNSVFYCAEFWIFRIFQVSSNIFDCQTNYRLPKTLAESRIMD